MPIYEFQCLSCGHMFEELVFGRSTPACPQCGGKKNEKVISRPARSRSSSHDYDSADAPASSGCGCGSCGGGNCASCGH